MSVVHVSQKMVLRDVMAIKLYYQKDTGGDINSIRQLLNVQRMKIVVLVVIIPDKMVVVLDILVNCVLYVLLISLQKNRNAMHVQLLR